jgi:hypothetical protein
MTSAPFDSVWNLTVNFEPAVYVWVGSLPWSVIRSEGPLGEPVDALRVAPPQPKLSVGTLVVIEGVPDDVVLPVDVLPVDVVPVDVVPVDVVPVDVLPVDVLPVDVLPVDVLPVDDVVAAGDVAAADDDSPAHPIIITEAAAAAAVRVERLVMTIAASFRSWRIQVEG